MPTPPSPGQPLLLTTHSRCECGWDGYALDRAGAALLWAEHAQRAGHDQSTNHEEID